MEEMSICDDIKKRYIRLSKGQRKVAQYVVDNPNIVATQVASEVGRLAGVSESTVIRFCYAMSLTGYNELQDRMKQYLIEKDGTVPVLPKTRTLKKQNIPFNEGISKHMKDLLTVMQQTDEHKCNAVIKLLHNAKDIYIVGFRDAMPAAFTLFFELGQYRDRVHMLQHDASKIVADLVQVNDSSVLFIMNTDSSNEEALAIADIAQRKKSTIITVTNEQYEQLQQYCNVACVLNNKKQLEDGTATMYAFVHTLVKCLIVQYDDMYQKKDNVLGERFIKKLIEVS